MDIQQAADRLSLTPDTIRRWERIGTIPPIKRNADGLREFNNEDLEWLEFTKTLTAMHVSTDFQIEYVKLAKMGKKATPARQALLKEQLSKLASDHQCLMDEINHIEDLVEDKQAV